MVHILTITHSFTPYLNYFLLLSAFYVYWERDVSVMPPYYLFWRPGVFILGICTKYEPCAKLHRVHILYITRGLTPHLNLFLLLSADFVNWERDFSVMLSYYLSWRPGVFILGICTKYEPCAKLHRVHILYITRDFTPHLNYLLLTADYVNLERDVSIVSSYSFFWRPGVFILPEKINNRVVQETHPCNSIVSKMTILNFIDFKF